MVVACGDGGFESHPERGDGLVEDGPHHWVKVPDGSVVEQETGETDAALERRVAFCLARGCVAVAVEGVLHVQDLVVEVVFCFVGEVVQLRLWALDPFCVPG